MLIIELVEYIENVEVMRQHQTKMTQKILVNSKKTEIY